MSIRTVLLSCTLLAAGACGPTATKEIKLPDGPPDAPYAVADATAKDGSNTIVNDADVTQIIVDGRTLSSLQRFASLDTPAGQGTDAIEYYRTPIGGGQKPEQNLWRGETNSGAGKATLIGTHRAEGYSIRVAQVERTGSTTIPVTGAAYYNGLYAGTLNNIEGSAAGYADNNADGAIRGTATMTANFATARTEGTISDRAFYSTSTGNKGEEYEDITLELGGIEDGAFFGTTTGGLYFTEDPLKSEGTYEGLFVGANGQEAVGTINMIHHSNNSGSSRIAEHGIFILNQSAP